MKLPHGKDDHLTPSQRRAVAARGNVLVMAGAGTGKTRTLVDRCLDCLCEENPRVSLDEILIVTFTEAAATEMRHRLRRALEIKSQENPDDSHCAEQLALFDAAHIGTLHSFCLKLVRDHFYELGLDPQLAMLAEGEARLLADETLNEQFQSHHEGQNEFSTAVQNLIQIYGGGHDEKIRLLVLRLHNYSQTRPDAEGWLARQIGKFAAPTPDEWQTWLLAGIHQWRDEWLPVFENLRAENAKAAECLEVLKKLLKEFSREQAAIALGEIQNASTVWPKGKKGILEKPLEKFFADAAFLNSLATIKGVRDPLAEDWDWIRGPMTALLRLAQDFSARFAVRKRADGVLDFHDLEQFALKLLWDFETEKPTQIAERWREKLRFVFVDECQDINAAQDKIISALSRDGENANRFLVGDVKQSIYRFRLADPKIFRDYARDWCGKDGQTISLTENFRSRESLLKCVNSVFELLMHEEIGGVNYAAGARLQFGSLETRVDLSSVKDSSPRTELLLRIKTERNDTKAEDISGANALADLEESEKEARLLASRLTELKNRQQKIWDDRGKIFRAVDWRDMAVLLRSPAGKADIFAKQFERADVPLVVERGGFYDSAEILDLLCLLQLLDNPLQDIPCIAVLRSPLAGLSLDELAQIRLVAKDVHFWTALVRSWNSKIGSQNKLLSKIEKFLKRFARWRKLVRQASLSQCLEDVLAETHYADWLQAQPRGVRRRANVEQFLNLAQKFDHFQRQGLFRFLKFVEAQREIEAEPEVAPLMEESAVRLMSIHQSKGLEFPIVAIADLAKPFNEQDLRGEIILDEQFGLCPRVKPPQTGSRYPSLPHWLAQRNQKKELRGEELRLLYVAMTRARDNLILTASITVKKWETIWAKPSEIAPQKIVAAKSFADWFGLWFAQNMQGVNAEAMRGELPHLHWRVVNDEELAGKKTAEEKTDAGLAALDGESKQKLREVLNWQYKFNEATQRAAKSSVTALRRQAADELDGEAESIFVSRDFTRATGRRTHGKSSATETGVAHHKFLQHFSFESAINLESLKVEAQRLQNENFISADESAVLNLNAIAAFWKSDAGEKILNHASNVKRELPFTAKFTPKELDGIFEREPAANLGNEFIVVQGVADLVVLLPDKIWLADFKTDEVHADELAGKIEIYLPQLKIYASALAKIYDRPATNCWLHFLSAQKTVDVKI
jgi:ATP-dependent helicase/nuclease subunit A